MASSKKTEYEIALLVGGKVQASFGNSIKDVNNSFDSMTNMAKSAAKMVTAAFATVQVGQFIGDAVETYSSFEQAMANTAAIARASETDFERLEEAALEMGKATTKTATEASEALGYMALAGWSVDDSITALEPVLRLSEATQMDLATCSDLVTDSMSALGLSIDELSGYLDVCTAANNNANTTAEALMEALIGCGGAAKTVGVDITDTATALGVLANNGTKGAEAGTALNSMLVRMTSKDAAITAMEALGVSAFDAAGNFIGLEEVLVDLQQALSTLSAEEQAAYMSKIAGTNYYTEMSYLLDAVAESADGTASAWDSLSGALENSDGALMNMAATVTDTLSTSFQILNSATEDAQIHLVDAFGDDLKDIILDLAAFIPELTENFVKFADKAGPKIS
ncbi:MAG: phage tail tape measure protein [Clostridia bacterium]|nr:phage tail tape measure protein [Clostridia bacterium]